MGRRVSIAIFCVCSFSFLQSCGEDVTGRGDRGGRSVNNVSVELGFPSLVGTVDYRVEATEIKGHLKGIQDQEVDCETIGPWSFRSPDDAIELIASSSAGYRWSLAVETPPESCTSVAFSVENTSSYIYGILIGSDNLLPAQLWSDGRLMGKISVPSSREVFNKVGEKIAAGRYDLARAILGQEAMEGRAAMAPWSPDMPPLEIHYGDGSIEQEAPWYFEGGMGYMLRERSARR